MTNRQGFTFDELQQMCEEAQGAGNYAPFIDKYFQLESYTDPVSGKLSEGYVSRAYTNKTLRDDMLLYAIIEAGKLKNYNSKLIINNIKRLPAEDALGLAACIILIGDKVATKDWAVTIEGIPKKYIKLYRKCRLSGRSRFNKK